MSPAHRMAYAHAFGITPRRLEVLECSAEGMTAKEIAKELRMSANTVKVHMIEIRSRLAAMTIAHAVAIGFRNHFLK